MNGLPITIVWELVGDKRLEGKKEWLAFFEEQTIAVYRSYIFIISSPTGIPLC